MNLTRSLKLRLELMKLWAVAGAEIEAMPSRVARLRLAQAVDAQFDTTVVAAFEAILATASDGYREGSTAVWDVERRPLRVASASA